MRLVLPFIIASLPLAAWRQTGAQSRPGDGRMVDYAIVGGRVIDPASGLDAVRNVGISGGRVVALTTASIPARHQIEAHGLVVAPGFIDLHAHGQDDESYSYYAMDGVTTALELETGIGPVTQFYSERAGKARVNFGGSASHFQARRVALNDTLQHYMRDRYADTSTRWSHTPTTPAILSAVSADLSRALDSGALGIGLGIAYVPGASRIEILRTFELCASRRVVCFAHIRGGRGGGASSNEPALIGLEEVLTDALVAGAMLHVVHINSTSAASQGDPDAGEFLRAIHAARAHGIDVTTESYPYTVSSTGLQYAIYDDALNTPGFDFSKMVWAATGEHLTRESFIKYRAIGGAILHLGGADSLLYPIFRDSIVMVASDAVPYANHRGNPRLAGTFARVLGRFSRDQKLFSLKEALRRMTYLPAKRLEGWVPQMRTKGRIGVGMDADIVVFDPARVIDRATVEAPAQYSAGIVYVFVNGVPVVRDEHLVDGAYPGIGIRRPIRVQ